MDHFEYRDGVLHCENLSLTRIADPAGTPSYVYSAQTFIDHFTRLERAFAELDPLICYSIKSCSNLSILRLLKGQGAGMDVVSGNELRRAIDADVDPADCVYAGVGKTDEEITFALESNLGWFNVESEQEFENIARIAAAMKRECHAALRINPDVDPRTHRYTTTGKKQTKFGVDIERAKQFFATYGGDKYCRLDALHLHLGSPIFTTEPYERAIQKTLALIDELNEQGFPITMLDLGGGFGANYETAQSPVAAEYAAAIVPPLRERVKAGMRLVLEPGRTIAANAGVLLLRVLYTKTSGDKTFIICDAGMNALIRPCHYDAFHFIWPVEVDAEFIPPSRAKEMNLDGLKTVDVVGPVCETGDFLAVDRPLPPLQRGDLLAVFSAGAYGMVMASRYNSFALPAEVLVHGDDLHLVRARDKYDDIVSPERKVRTLSVPQTAGSNA